MKLFNKEESKNNEVKKVHENEIVKEPKYQAKYYKPLADVFENEGELIIELDVPGVTKENVDITLEKDILTIEGKINLSDYDKLSSVYAEYNIGHFIRKFEIQEKINSEKIDAKLSNGVLELHLPKLPEMQPRKIQIN